MDKTWIKEAEFHGQLVSLIPMERTHRDNLVEAASDGKLWELWYTSVPSITNVDSYIEEALRQKKEGLSLPFTVVHKKEKKIIGSTRYCSIDAKHRRLEIGYTWYAASYWKSLVNTETKLLLLRYAFEELNCIAVEFKTNWHNMSSRQAILGLGARQEGVIRNHRINDDGSYRDSVIFSITEQEWSGVKKTLELRMSRYG